MSYPLYCIVLTHHFDALPQITHDDGFGVFHGFKVVSPHFADLPNLPLQQLIKVSVSRFTVPTFFSYARSAVFHFALGAVLGHTPHC